MNVDQALSIFRNNLHKTGSFHISPYFFDYEIRDMIEAIKKGYHPFSHDLVVLVSALMGLGSDKVCKRINSLRSMTHGIFEKFEDGF